MVRVSVVIPTYNRLERLKDVLRGLEDQTVPCEAFEVVVVADGCSDGTDAYLEEIETPLQIKGLQQPNGGAASARNYGISQATGDIVLFLDDDVVPAPQLIAEHLRCFDASGDEVVVLGPMLSPPNFRYSAWVAWEQRMLVKQYNAMQAGLWQPTGRQFYTGNSSVARRFLVAAGGFDPAFRRAEDVELAYRLADMGLRFQFNPSAVGYHYAKRSLASWMKTPYAYGSNDVIFYSEKGQSWIMPTMRKEFKTRNPLIQLLVRTCINRHLLSKVVIAGLVGMTQAGYWLGLERVCNVALSGIFNLRYYQGVADQSGGQTPFLVEVGKEYEYA
jgi:glycosyltransferase involved in cell wall biosynthesis